MARKAREKSPIGVYTVRLRSENYQFSREDHELFLRCLTSFEGYSILYYLLSKSQLSFVIKEDTMSLEQMMRKVSVKFVRAYQKAHQIENGIFDDRFHSQAAKTIEDVYGMIGKMVNLVPSRIQIESITMVRNAVEDPYLDHEFFYAHFKDAIDFNEKCHAHIDLEEGARKLSDEELKHFLRTMYQVEPEDLLKLPKSHVISIIDGVMSFTKTSARQIARVSTLPVRWLWKVTKKWTSKAKLKTEKKVTQDD